MAKYGSLQEVKGPTQGLKGIQQLNGDCRTGIQGCLTLEPKICNIPRSPSDFLGIHCLICLQIGYIISLL